MIYVFGGQRVGGGAGITSVEAYDPATDSWLPRASMPGALLGMTANAVNDKCYLIGGSAAPGDNALNRVDEYDPVTDSWRRRADMPTARVAGASTVMDSKIYVAGGWVTGDIRSAAVASLEIYDPASNIWTSGADMPTARAALAAGVANKEVLYIGGGSMPLGTLDSPVVESYDPATNTWARLADMPTPRGALTAATVNGLVHAIGGGFNIGQVPAVEVYDPLTNVWSERTQMPTARWGIANGVLGQKVYVLGGSTEQGIGHNSLPTNEVYTTGSHGINYGHSGAWFNPEIPGQGQLVDVEPESKFLFLSWFTFTEANSASPNEQHWFTAQGNYTGDTADLLVYETLGGRFDAPEEVSTEAVGSATLSFTDCSNGQLDYTIDNWGVQGSFPLRRAIPGTENVCEERAELSNKPLEPNEGRDGAWYDPASPGQGFLIDAQPGNEFIFVAWFTYGEDTISGQRWLTAQGPLQGSTADLVLYETLGGSFDNPAPNETNAVGTMTIDFTDCSNALLNYSITDDALAGMIDIERAIPGTEALCEELTQ
jgi:N-acetylneuraminic acid mutarotase